MAYKLCKDCGQPMLPQGVKKRPNEYDHAQGCPSAPAPSPASEQDMERRARDIAIRVLQSCAAHYANPEWFVAYLSAASPQVFIDRAISNATKIIAQEVAAERKQVVDAVLKLLDDCGLHNRVIFAAIRKLESRNG